eukprot:SAG22_NODE_236_length_14254_cov_3.426492_6_plen_147_part_00
MNGCQSSNKLGSQMCTSLVDADKVAAAVKAADHVIMVMGLDIKVTNSEGRDRTQYALPWKQPDLIKAVATVATAASVAVTVVVLSGGAVGLDFVADQQPYWSVLFPGHGGNAGPVAIAAAMFGDFSPSGLPSRCSSPLSVLACPPN